jgi:hypothetical protein
MLRAFMEETTWERSRVSWNVRGRGAVGSSARNGSAVVGGGLVVDRKKWAEAGA